MMDSNKSYFVGFVSSVLIYVISISGLTYTYISSNIKMQRFTAKKNDFLDVVLIESKQSSKQSNTKSPKGSTTTKQTSTADVKNLFSKVDTSKLQNIEQPTKPASTPSRLKGETQDTNASNITSLLDNLNIKSQASYNASSTATYNESIGKIIDILDEEWQKHIDLEPGPEAIVQIIINPSGDLSYNIKRLSKSYEFNEKLNIYLENMKKIKFPIMPNGQDFNFDFKFNIELEIDL